MPCDHAELRACVGDVGVLRIFIATGSAVADKRVLTAHDYAATAYPSHVHDLARYEMVQSRNTCRHSLS